MRHAKRADSGAGRCHPSRQSRAIIEGVPEKETLLDLLTGNGLSLLCSSHVLGTEKEVAAQVDELEQRCISERRGCG